MTNTEFLLLLHAVALILGFAFMRWADAREARQWLTKFVDAGAHPNDAVHMVNVMFGRNMFKRHQ